MKHTPPQPPPSLTFEELVSRAKASETQLSPAALDGMLQRFEARLKVEAATQALHGSAVNPASLATNAARVGNLGAASKSLIAGAGIAAVAAFIYSANVRAPEFPTTKEVATRGAEGAASAVTAPITHDGVQPLTPDGVQQLTPGGAHVAPHANANDGRSAAPAAPDALTQPARGSSATSRLTSRLTSRSSRATEPSRATVTPAHTTPSSTAAPANTEQPAVATPASTKPTPALDTSLAQLERAERELRAGNPSAALTTLALPVVPSLASRVEALRAVALCQSGQVANGRRLGTAHLVRNPRSPYEQRLQRACGEL